MVNLYAIYPGIGSKKIVEIKRKSPKINT